MATIFPTDPAPQDGDPFTGPNGVRYVFNATTGRWRIAEVPTEGAGAAAEAVSAHDTDERHISGTQAADITAAKAHADSAHDYDPAGTAAGAVSAHDTDAKHFTGTQAQDLTDAKAHADVTTGNPHSVTADDLSLGNVDNTSDADKPVSSATQTALNLKSDTGHDHDGAYDPAGAASSAVFAAFSGHMETFYHQPLSQPLAAVATSNDYRDLDYLPDLTPLDTAVQPGDASPQSAITDLTGLTLDQAVHTYTSASADVLSATALEGGWTIIYVSAMDTVTADAAIEWLSGTDINDLAAGTELLLRSDGTTVYASIGVPT